MAAEKRVKLIVDVERGKTPSPTGAGGGPAVAAAFGGSGGGSFQSTLSAVFGGGLGAFGIGGAALGSMLALGKQGSPALANEFDRAVHDASVVLGEIFTPVLKMATQAIRSWADALQSSKEGGLLGKGMGAFDFAQKYYVNPQPLSRSLFATLGPLLSGAPGSSYGAAGFNAKFDSAQAFAREQSAAALAATRSTKPEERMALDIEKIRTFVESYGPSQRMWDIAKASLGGTGAWGG